MDGSAFSFGVAVTVGAGAATGLSGPPEASHMTPPTSTAAAAAPPSQSPVLDFLIDAKEGSVARAALRVGGPGLEVMRCVEGIGPCGASGAGGRFEMRPGAASGGIAVDAAQGPAEERGGGRSETGRALTGGGVRPGSRITFAPSSVIGEGFAGAWLAYLAWAVNAAALTSALVPPPCSARMSPAESVPAPVNGASSSSHDGRNAVASRSRSSGESGAFSKGAGPLGGLPG